MRAWLWFAFLTGIVVPASAQMRLGPDCRPLPLPGYMMSPAPPDPECLRAQAQEEQDMEAARRRQQAQAAAAAAARREHLAAESAQCATASADDVRIAIERDPAMLERYDRILDVTEPHFGGDKCRSEAMTPKGVVSLVITFQDFNGKRYILARPNSGKPTR